MENQKEKCARCHFKIKNSDKYYCGLTFQDINDEPQCIIEIIENLKTEKHGESDGKMLKMSLQN